MISSNELPIPCPATVLVRSRIGAFPEFAAFSALFAATDLTVTTRDINNIEVTLAYPADYSVSGVGNGSGGSVTLTKALAVLVRRKEKIAEIIKNNNIRSITHVHMEVPCCFGLGGIIKEAIESSKKSIPFKELIISIKGEVLR